MTAIAFDTLAYAKKMKELGFTEKQPEGQAEELAKIIDNQIATKRDLREWAYKIILSVGGMLVASVSILYNLLRGIH
ncbi:hypothetical protein UFOVP93_34 [uncultured Caudovirales phage]|uniref:DUF1640 domain-containing protein n=1 Tax=uncultured Caudovirales phage TaxID=2100421 RepID=A0A6J5L303_9CAUD|nr:hypothetical protein UFOVP93_34 [uncultured Caudovirales phage]